MKKVTVVLAVVAIMITTNFFAQDPPRTKDKVGAKDYPSISRYKDAVIQEYNTINYTNFYFGIGVPVNRDFKGHGKFFSKYIEINGKLYNYQYLIPKDEGILKVYENYKHALTNANYNILFTDHNGNTCFWSDDYGDFSKTTRDYYGSGGCDKDYYYMVAKGQRDSIDVYVSLYISTGGNYGKSFVVVNQSIIETEPLELGLVKAKNIAQNIDITGYSVFYDIHFASGNAKIETESDIQINEIAKYIKQHTNKKYYIVGHTDNVGNFSSNKSLSEERAKSVVNELITKYKVNAEQLKYYGIANLSPVTSNSTDEGKARNRRVEIVEQ